MYDATLGRFIQRDPQGYRDGPSLYQYVGSHPTVLLDAYGLIKGEGKYEKCDKCPDGWKEARVQAFILVDANDTTGADFVKGNDIYEQCCVKIVHSSTAVYYKQLTEEKIGADHLLDEYDPGKKEGGKIKPTAEETALTKNMDNLSLVHAYYVKGLAPAPGSTGEAFWFAEFSAPPAPGFVRTNSGNTITWSHEIGHVLLDSGDHVANERNLMFGAKSETKFKLTEAQCDKIRQNKRLVK